MAAAFPEFIDPNPAPGNRFGERVVPLSTGNVVISSPYDDAGGENAGAVYLFNGATGELISTLIGSQPNDNVGFGVTALSNGNYVVHSPRWDNGSTIDVGAVTWGDGTTGVSGVISPGNSLIGSASGDQVGRGITVLSNGNFVVRSEYWDNGSATDAGAATWVDGTAGAIGIVGAGNSLVGSTSGDRIGHNVTALTNGNYVAASRYWNNGSATEAGAATWGDGTTGVNGIVGPSNSLVGSTSGDQVSIGGVVPLSNGNYVVRSFNWNNGAATNAGAATWGDGMTGVSGVVGPANSLVGSSIYDNVGFGVTALSNGNYVVSSASWDNGAATDAGMATWGDGTVGVTGLPGPGRSLVGSSINDAVGRVVTALSNGNYVVESSSWRNGAGVNVGAVTWGDGTVGIAGVVETSNSLVGSTSGDFVALDVTALSNGNYVIQNTYWNNGAANRAGAVTWGNGATGTTGVVDPSNSLVGTTSFDQVGNGVIALPNGNYVVKSPEWDSGSAADVGAATWGDGTTGVSGVVGPGNSLIGSTDGDKVGFNVTSLSNGNYVVGSYRWSAARGAATWGDGTAGTTGVVGLSNSLVGSTSNNLVGQNVTALPNGNYVVRSPNWDSGGFNNVGAVTWGDGTIGVTGAVGSGNSLVGSTSSDQVGYHEITAFPNGNFVTTTRFYDDGSNSDAGIATFIDGQFGDAGAIETLDSIVGSTSDTQLQETVIYDEVNGHFFVRFRQDGGGRVRVGSVATGFAEGSIQVRLTDGTLSIRDLDNRNNELTVSRVGEDVVIVATNEVFISAPNGATLSNANQTLTIPASLITGSMLIDTAGGDDSLVMVGSGLTQGTYVSGGIALGDAAIVTNEGGQQFTTEFSAVESLAVEAMLTFDIEGALPIGTQELQVDALSLLELGNLTSLAGGTIAATGGLRLDSLLHGFGTVAGAFASTVGSTVRATGNLELGDALAFDGFFSDGRLWVNDHSVILYDANEAVLGALTVLGDGVDGGALIAANGFLLEEGKVVQGVGTINGEFHNDGHVEGTDAGIEFMDLVTGIGSATNVTYSGGMSPGHSPAEVDLGGVVSLADSNTLYIELGGLATGEFDRLNSTGAVAIDGALTVSLINGYMPTVGDAFEFIAATGGVAGEFDDVTLPTLPSGMKWVLTYEANAVRLVVAASGSVVNRQLFYYNSAFSGDAAIANKTAFRAGEASTYHNYSNYVHGINGMVVDIDGLAAPANLTASDFGFRVGRTSDTATWADLNALATVAVRSGEGPDGSDRIVLTWPNGTITNTWLEVTVKANANTGLAEPDIFYFGNQIGDTNGDGLTNASDFAAIRGNQTSFLNPADVDNAFDINKDGLVNATDLLIVRDHFTPIANGLPMITPSGPSSLKAGHAGAVPVVTEKESKQASHGLPVRETSDTVELDTALIASTDAAILAEYGSSTESTTADDLLTDENQGDELPLDLIASGHA